MSKIHQVIHGDMIEGVTEGHIIHGCNCQGVMGGGIALAIRNKWPVVYQDYRQHFINNGLTLGEVIPVPVSEKLIVWNCMTQEFYKGHKNAPDLDRYVSYDAIEKCLGAVTALMPVCLEAGVPMVLNYPLIGAGLAQGNWSIIQKIIEETVPYNHNEWHYSPT